MTELAAAAASIRAAIDVARKGLVDRDVLVELIALGAVANEHVLVVGPPGTAKSEAARRFARAVGGDYFEYLLGRFTEPSELFGPVDLRKLRDGVVETRTEGMLPEAEIAFLDEVFLGSTAILNTLLALLNERRFRRGATVMRCPLRVCVGASNAIPQETTLAAFADRFLVHVFVDAVPESRLEDLMEAGWSLGGAEERPSGDRLAALDALTAALPGVDVAGVRDLLARAIARLRGAGIVLSDRRIVRLQRLVAAAAALDGRKTATAADVWPIVYAVPSADAQRIAREVLEEELAESKSTALAASAADASLGPLARADRIAAEGERLFATEAERDMSWTARAESLAREIDATFPRDAIPEKVEALRARLSASLAPHG